MKTIPPHSACAVQLEIDGTMDKRTALEAPRPAPIMTLGTAFSRGSIMVLLPAILWIWMCRDWPARLGFYSDDWMVLLHPFVGTAQAFHDTARLVATRPVSIPFIWLAQLIVDWSPARSQILNALMLLVSAASVGLLAAVLASVVRGIREAGLVGASVAAAAFVVFPSNVGIFAWGVGVTTVIPALPLFCLGTSLLLRAERSWLRLASGLALALLSHLSYEAFYLQEITFVLIAATLRGSRIKDLPWRVLIGVVLVNIGCIAFNRLTQGGIQKSFHPEFLQTFVVGYSHVLDILGHATREHKHLIVRSVLIAGLAGAICLAGFVGFVRLCIATMMAICGIVAAGFLYAFAGYGLAAEGPMARVSIIIAMYSSIVSGVLAVAAWNAFGWRRLPAAAFCVFAVSALVGLGLTTRSRVGEWAATWSYELARLSRLPAAVVSADRSAGGGQPVYIAIENRDPSFIEPATAPWEISGAVAWAINRTTNSRSMMEDVWTRPPRWFAAPHGWFNRWDGQNFQQGFCKGSVIVSASGTELWSWNTSSSTLTKIEAPWEAGCQR